jgi:cellulose synthase (UDP-forming)
VPGRLYGRTATEIAGPLQPTSHEVRYRKVLTPRQLAAVVSLGGLHIALVGALAVFLILPMNFPRLLPGGTWMTPWLSSGCS